jgi:P-type Mg2+ transporter
VPDTFPNFGGAREDGKHILICKGAIEEVFAACARYEIDGEVGPLDQSHLDTAQQESAALNADGFRVIAVAYKELNAGKDAYTVDIYRAAFNHAFAARTGDPRQEEAAHRIAWAVVKRS